jgi:hypothetical protein
MAFGGSCRQQAETGNHVVLEDGVVRMTTSDVSRQPLQINRGFVVSGAVLVGVGGLLGATGVLLGTFAILSATRQWMKQLETPPSELATQRLHQAKVATAAAAEAWRAERKPKIGV